MEFLEQIEYLFDEMLPWCVWKNGYHISSTITILLLPGCREEYYIKVGLGDDAAKTYNLHIDTGSCITWVHCDYGDGYIDQPVSTLYVYLNTPVSKHSISDFPSGQIKYVAFHAMSLQHKSQAVVPASATFLCYSQYFHP